MCTCTCTEEERSDSLSPPTLIIPRPVTPLKVFLPILSSSFSSSGSSFFFFPILSAEVVCVSPCYFAALLSLDSRLISVQPLCWHKEATHWFLLFFFFFFHYPNTEAKQRREGVGERKQKREKRKRWVEGIGGTMSRREREWRTRGDWSYCHRQATFSFQGSSEPIDLQHIDICSPRSPPAPRKACGFILPPHCEFTAQTTD